MKIGIVGGALQGMEAVYLSTKAGYETVVIDKKENAPALSLCDVPVVSNILTEPEKVRSVLSDCDVVIPAFEELEALGKLDKMMKELGKPFLFDIDSYDISCSKEMSNNIMAKAGVPLPKPWPECGFPMVVKPSSQSGSIGVSVVNEEKELAPAMKIVEDLHDTPIMQEFVSGKSVSVEVVGNGSDYKSFVTTEVVLDHNYDCKMVVCKPDILCPEDNDLFKKIGEDIAHDIGLKALMDVEAIMTDRGLRVLEIDARIPSQTPAAILAGTSINILDELVRIRLGMKSNAVNTNGYSTYEHYVIKDGKIITCGEKQFGKVQHPCFANDFFGENEVITDYKPGKPEWRATVITKGKNSKDLLSKRMKFVENVMEECGLVEYVDRSPEMV